MVNYTLKINDMGDPLEKAMLSTLRWSISMFVVSLAAFLVVSADRVLAVRHEGGITPSTQTVFAGLSR